MALLAGLKARLRHQRRCAERAVLRKGSEPTLGAALMPRTSRVKKLPGSPGQPRRTDGRQAVGSSDVLPRKDGREKSTYGRGMMPDGLERVLR